MPNRRDVLKLAAGANALALLANGANAVPDVVMDEKNAKRTREAYGDLAIYFDGPTDQLKALTAGRLHLKPGMVPHPPHQHPEEEIMLVAEGTGEISVEGKVTKVAPGSMMYCAGNKVHGIVNTGQTPMLFYFYKWKA